MPLASGSPDIDVRSSITMRLMEGNILRIEGTMKGDGFPNAELFVGDAANNRIMLNEFTTTGGKMGPAYMLFGEGDAAMGSFMLDIQLDAAGNFTGVRQSSAGEFTPLARPVTEGP